MRRSLSFLKDRKASFCCSSRDPHSLKSVLTLYRSYASSPEKVLVYGDMELALHSLGACTCQTVRYQCIYIHILSVNLQEDLRRMGESSGHHRTHSGCVSHLVAPFTADAGRCCMRHCCLALRQFHFCLIVAKTPKAGSWRLKHSPIPLRGQAGSSLEARSSSAGPGLLLCDHC